MTDKPVPPLHWVNPDNIALIAFGTDVSDRVQPYRGTAGRPYFEISDIECPPWQNRELLSFLDENECRQIAIFASTLTAGLTALAMMTGERGHDVFLVSDAVNSASSVWLKRLGKTHAILIDKHWFREEWNLVSGFD
ncbi:hypothetical protein [Hyphomonas sp.]|uniref:hypothetical protein n=1 Tax=Hyphomonas sp. TaxID=87 RepID=UPI0025C4D811|nr:hypothetical protein [Hyphomonas sp.]